MPETVPFSREIEYSIATFYFIYFTKFDQTVLMKYRDILSNDRGLPEKVIYNGIRSWFYGLNAFQMLSKYTANCIHDSGVPK